MRITERHRVAGTIDEVRPPHIEDHGIATVQLMVDCGYHQGFGGVALDRIDGPLMRDYVSSLCSTFGVARIEDLKGKRCFALYNWGEHNELIAGLESVDTGRRFLHNAWAKKHFPDEVRRPIDERRMSIQRRIERLAAQLDEERSRLVTLAVGYVDWERV